MTVALNSMAHSDDRVACQATGQPVRASETIHFQGQLVSARGKQVLIDRIRAGESAGGHLERPAAGRRIAAIAIDILILIAVDLLFNVALTGKVLLSVGAASVTEMGIIIFIEAMVATAYFTALHAWRGQSLGKMVGRLKVVTVDGAPLTLSQATIRSLASYGPLILVGLSLLPGASAMSLIISVGSGVFAMADAVTAALDRRQRALHDLLARTRVVHLETPPVIAPPGLACPTCGREIELAPGQVRFRCDCGWIGDVYRFQPFAPPIPPVEDAGTDDAGCAYHPTKRAIAICAGSGDYVCSICAAELAGKPFGIQYLEQAGKLDLLRAFDRYLPRPDSLVFVVCVSVLSVFGLFIASAMLLAAIGNPALMEAMAPLGIIAVSVSISSVIWVPMLWVRLIGSLRLGKRNALYRRVSVGVRLIIGVVLLSIMSFFAAAIAMGLIVGIIGVLSRSHP